MADTYLLPQLILHAAVSAPDAVALRYGPEALSYAQLQAAVDCFSNGVAGAGLRRGERIAVYLEKRFETVIACFGAAAAGCVFVPLNPLLKADQVAYILRDCNVRMLITSSERYVLLHAALADCPDLRHVVVVTPPLPATQATVLTPWAAFLQAPPAQAHRTIDTDVAAILYTSGSTGKPKGVVLSHRNMVAGAKSVASYLENCAEDVLLAALPLSFDAGFSQLTTAIHVGASVVLLNYLMPRDVVKAVHQHGITGLTAVPPLYIQLSQLDWPAAVTGHLRYFANTGGRLPPEALARLRAKLPRTKPYLMYGLTEAFRSTYLPPEEIDRRPDSIGKAIPNAEILVLREDGTPCQANEAGELVHRGALVGLGYWNDPEKTAERYKPLPPSLAGREPGLVLAELAVFSGDTVRMDEDGFLYFIGRRDDMMKTSGYRVSPTEVEEVLHATGLVAECVAFGVNHDTLGQTIQAIVTPLQGLALEAELLLAECRKRMPAYMVPHGIEIRSAPLPRNPNGKIDRPGIVHDWMLRQHH